MNPSLSKREINRQRWLERIAEWKKSGQSQKAFCECHQLGLASFRRWNKVFSSKDRSREPQPVNFMPVKVKLKDIPSSSLTLLINDNLRIEIPAGFDPCVLKQVIQLLQMP